MVSLLGAPSEDRCLSIAFIVTIVPTPFRPCRRAAPANPHLRRGRVFAGGLPVRRGPPPPPVLATTHRTRKEFEVVALLTVEQLERTTSGEMDRIVRRRASRRVHVVRHESIIAIWPQRRRSSRRGGALDLGPSDCRHFALSRIPAGSECRRTVADNMHAYGAPPYLAISTIDAVGAWRVSLRVNSSGRRNDRPSSPHCLKPHRVAPFAVARRRHALRGAAADPRSRG
jgi:hypothetical protein